MIRASSSNLVQRALTKLIEKVVLTGPGGPDWAPGRSC
jgi:hypothetical protein